MTTENEKAMRGAEENENVSGERWHIFSRKILDGKIIGATIAYGLNQERDGPEGYVCVMCEGFGGRTEDRARLIAAAPDLYAALDSFVIYFVEGDDRLWLSADGVVGAPGISIDPQKHPKFAAALLRINARQQAALAKARQS